jgi:hypothetical protein
MRIGIDFDNTIACYDGVFYAAARQRGLIPPHTGRDKTSVRDHLNDNGRTDAFTELQGYVYGAGMDLAVPYPGFADFVATARRAGHDLFVVSHRTRYPILGPSYDLHEAGRTFLSLHDLVGNGTSQIDPCHVFFELTKDEKVARAAAISCDIFIDDLPDILTMPGFPMRMRRILFDPANRFADATAAHGSIFDRCLSWAAVTMELVREPV